MKIILTSILISFFFSLDGYSQPLLKTFKKISKEMNIPQVNQKMTKTKLLVFQNFRRKMFPLSNSHTKFSDTLYLVKNHYWEVDFYYFKIWDNNTGINLTYHPYDSMIILTCDYSDYGTFWTDTIIRWDVELIKEIEKNTEQMSPTRTTYLTRVIFSAGTIDSYNFDISFSSDH